MRRIVTTAVAMALVGGATLSAPAVAADHGRPSGTTGAQQQTRALEQAADKLLESGLALPPAASEVAQVSAPEALATARRVLSGQALPRDPSATLALRDLFMKRSELRGRDLRNAEALLARPSDGAGDNQGFGYTVPEAPPVCNTRLCVHYVPTGADAPPTPDWPAHNLAVMDSVWSTIVDNLDYRAPLSDRSAGGNALFDVYLKDLGEGLYGFCAPERRVKNRTASGYCVLDNDYAAAQFPVGTPRRQPRRHRRSRVLPRRAVRLRLRRGPLDDGVHRDVDGGAGRDPGQRQPPVLPHQPDLRPLRAARHVQPHRHLPVRQLGVLGVPHHPLRHRPGQQGVEAGRLAAQGRREVQHPGAAEGAQAQGRAHQGLLPLRRRQPDPGAQLPRGRGVPLPQGPRRQEAEPARSAPSATAPGSTTSPRPPTSTSPARAWAAGSGSCR